MYKVMKESIKRVVGNASSHPLKNRRGAAMLVNMIIVAVMMGLMATSFAQLTSGQFASAEAYRTSYQAQQLVEAKANEIAVTSYSALAGEVRAVVTGATEWQREVILGPETDLGSGNMQRPVVISVYKDTETVARASTVKYPTSKGTAEGVPSGTIAIWKSSVATIPAGWVLCDGSNGTPDLRSRFVYGAGGDVNTKGSYSNGWNTVNGHFQPGVVGGEEQHVLTYSEMPSHSHNGYTDTQGSHTHGVNVLTGGFDSPRGYIAAGAWNTGGTIYVDYAGAHTHNVYTYAAGGGAAHNILPRFISLAYIMKT